ncbi:cyclase [Pseudoxanthomonas sp. NC8]|nr:cyclase [Pseudoxanthomonas sp. NC8]
MQHRVLFDFEITFSNGGDLRGRDFRLDVPGASIDEAALACHVIDDLRLLMVDTVSIGNVRIVEEAHKRAAPAAGATA